MHQFCAFFSSKSVFLHKFAVKTDTDTVSLSKEVVSRQQMSARPLSIILNKIFFLRKKFLISEVRQDLNGSSLLSMTTFETILEGDVYDVCLLILLILSTLCA